MKIENNKIKFDKNDIINDIECNMIKFLIENNINYKYDLIDNYFIIEIKE